ncbi:hypothetical protein [Streptomyces sp. HM190]|uniref:hypothetical protein n=1 Tax=Streptomyces sp. HM190 TaxID=2695266 RepID=UPI001917430B|nr:hypothetical protein [Streptomyces sp. HM190]
MLIGVGGVVKVGLMPVARRFLPAPAGGRSRPTVRRWFDRVSALQRLLSVAVVLLCRHLGVPVLLPPLVAVVVGPHFLPLAVVFEQPRPPVPAALSIDAGAVGATVRLIGGPDEGVRRAVGLTSALSLWGRGDPDGHGDAIHPRPGPGGVPHA